MYFELVVLRRRMKYIDVIGLKAVVYICNIYHTLFQLLLNDKIVTINRNILSQDCRSLGGRGDTAVFGRSVYLMSTGVGTLHAPPSP